MSEPTENSLPSDQRQKRIAVLGGSGFIGAYLVLDLLQMGEALSLLVNRTDPDLVSVRGRIETFKGSITNVASLEACFQGCRLVYHLVGIIAETRKKTFSETVVEGTKRVVAAAQACGVEKIIYLSALGASEKAEARYHQSKWAAEQAVVSSGLDYTIFRPSIIYGPGDRFINRIARMVKRLPVVPVIGDGLYRLQPMYVEELCALMAVASGGTFTSRQVYEIGGPDQLTYLEILDIIKRILRVRRPTVHLPSSLVKAVAGIMETFIKPAPITIDQLKMLPAGSTCDHRPAEKAFGVRFSPLETQLSKYLGK